MGEDPFVDFMKKDSFFASHPFFNGVVGEQSLAKNQSNRRSKKKKGKNLEHSFHDFMAKDLFASDPFFNDNVDNPLSIQFNGMKMSDPLSSFRSLQRFDPF